MSDISERIMRGQYVSKQECFEHCKEVERVMAAYPKAMAAMAAYERETAHCECEYDGGYGDDGQQVRGFSKPGCPVHAQDDAEDL